MKEKTQFSTALWTVIGLAITFAGSIGLGNPMAKVLSIFLGSLILWIQVGIDWPCLVTLLALGWMPQFGFAKTFTGAFGNSTVAFLIFTFALVYPLGKTTFVRRCTLAFLDNPMARKGKWGFLYLLFASVVFMGLFISPSVLFVAFLPFLEDILSMLNVEKGSRDGSMIMFSTAFLINLSSGMTTIGHVWPTLALGYYSSTTGNSVSALAYCGFGIAIGIALFLLLMLVLRFWYKPELSFEVDWEGLNRMRKNLPPVSKMEKKILITLGCVIALWILPGLLKGILPGLYDAVNGMTTAFPPLWGCTMLFISSDEKGESILNFREVTSKGILWGAVLMTGTATWLGACLTNEEIGLTLWLKETLSPISTALPPLLLVAFFVTWAILETNFSSNIVTTTVVSTMVVTVVSAMENMNLVAVLSLIGFSAAICNMTPAGQSTINTVAIGSGWTSTREMFKWGGVFALLAILTLTLIGYPVACALM